MTVRKFISEVFTKFTVPPIALGIPEDDARKDDKTYTIAYNRADVICSPTT